MGVKERKERDRQEMRELIIRTAHELFLDKGHENVSIRNIADMIEYSPAFIYLHFKDKRELFYAIKSEALEALHTFVIVDHQQKPFDRLTNLLEKCIAFSVVYPKYYTLLFMNEPRFDSERHDTWKEWPLTVDYLKPILDACQKAGHFKAIHTDVLLFFILSYLHGLCSLFLKNHSSTYSPDERDLLTKKSLQLFIAFLSSHNT